MFFTVMLGLNPSIQKEKIKRKELRYSYICIKFVIRSNLPSYSNLMFNNPSSPANNLPNTKTPPSPPAAAPSEPEDIFMNIDLAPRNSAALPPQPRPMEAPSQLLQEPVIKSTPSIFSATAQKVDQNIPSTSDIGTQPKTLDAKSLVLLVIISLIIIGTVAAAVWWFIKYNKNRNNNPNNSPAVNLFNELNNGNNTPAVNNVNPENSNLNANTNVPAVNNNLPPANPDTDGDGLTDEEEADLGTSLQAVDTDNDGLSDREEVKVYKTDPIKTDTDGDGASDGEEIQNKTDPLKPNGSLSAGVYTNNVYKFSFTPLSGMVLSSASDNLVLFNEDVNQIKLYIYLDNSQPEDLPAPDVSYLISADILGALTIKNSEQLPDQTPYSTELNTQKYEAANGFSYIIRYVAAKRASNHQDNFEALLKSFKFLKS